MTEDTDRLLEAMPFARGLGIEDVHATPDEVTGALPWREDLCTSGGVLHGGVLMSLGDALGAYCALLNLPAESTSTTTIESKTNFLRAVRGGRISATSRPLHRGRTMIVVDTEIRDPDGRLVARVTQTQAVLSR